MLTKRLALTRLSFGSAQTLKSAEAEIKTLLSSNTAYFESLKPAPARMDGAVAGNKRPAGLDGNDDETKKQRAIMDRQAADVDRLKQKLAQTEARALAAEISAKEEANSRELAVKQAEQKLSEQHEAANKKLVSDLQKQVASAEEKGRAEGESHEPHAHPTTNPCGPPN